MISYTYSIMQSVLLPNYWFGIILTYKGLFEIHPLYLISQGIEIDVQSYFIWAPGQW